MTLPIDLHGRRVLITGVSSGIGLGIAGSMAQAGGTIAGCGLEAATAPGVQAFFAAVQQHGQAATYTALDVRDDAALAAWVDEAAAHMGGIDLVISNAGRSVFKGAAACTVDEWHDAISLNLAAHWKLCKAAYPYLQQAQEPVIIIIASNHAYNTIPGCFPYNTAKAALPGLVQSLAIEWGPQVRAVGIAPGFIDTPGGDAWFNSFPDPAAERARTEAMHPAGRIGTPAEIGALCAFLCSPYSRFITGSTVLVDGGRSALMQDG
ncbi:MAG: SDR family oxidoreductase [Anaerolineae bacterium]|jgi:NAD(P)-dependent dehydrogenase (short-subunit alcohol dehydrogenase family)|nr:SDR family oxidoreductase [Anaerolineae bacterium]